MSPIANARRFAATALGDSLHHLEGGVRRHSGVTVGAGIERIMMPAFADLKVISPVAPTDVIRASSCSSPSYRPSSGRRCRTPSHAPRKTGSTFIDPTLPPDELIQRLRIRFVHRRVQHHAGPLAPSTLVGFCWIRGAPDNGGERVFPLRYFQPLQTQRPARSVGFTPAARRAHRIEWWGSRLSNRSAVNGHRR
jgi:hypothetical protein